jgi:CubicO group peptidase (beta-lactamase class C family)
MIDVKARTGGPMVLSLQTMKRVDDIVARTQADGRAPSVVAAVVRDGAVAHVVSASESPGPDRDTQFRIGSITKSLTAAVVLRLRDDDRLSLDDPLERHLPGTAVGAVPLRQLLAHAGGLQREPDGDWWERCAGSPLAALLEGVTPDKLAFRPYQRFHYSNLAYGLLGGVVERITGESWWDAVSSRVLGPLGMGRTTYEPQEPFARGYVVHPWHGTLREEPRHDAGAMAPAGQLWSTAADLARWAAVLASPSGAAPVLSPPVTKADVPVLAPSTLDEMAAPAVIADPDAWTNGYGLGLQLWRRGERVYAGHTGSMPGYLAVLAVHRASRTGVVAYANAYGLRGTGIGTLGLSILEAVLDSEPAPPPPAWRPGPPPPDDVAPLCGRWWWMGREYEARWDAARSELVIADLRNGADGDEWRFTTDAAPRWRGRSGENAGEVLTPIYDESGGVTALDIATFVFTRDPLPPD